MGAARPRWVFAAVVVGQGQLGNEQLSSETSSPLSPCLRLCSSSGKGAWGIFLEVREQSPKVSLVNLPSISPCSELYSSRAFHAMSSPCTTQDTTRALVRAHPESWAHRMCLWVFGMGLWSSVSTQRGQGWDERRVIGTFWATGLHVTRRPFGTDPGQPERHSWDISGTEGPWGPSSRGKPRPTPAMSAPGLCRG